MTKGFAKAHIYGNVTKDIELKKTNSGKDVASFTVAVNGTKDKTDFIDCVAWEKAAEILAKYVTKGKSVIIDGIMQQRQFEVDGQKRSKIEVIVRDFYFAGGKEDGDRPLKQHEVIQATYDNLPGDEADRPVDLSAIPF